MFKTRWCNIIEKNGCFIDLNISTYRYISKIKVNSSEIRSQDFRTIFNGILNTKNGYNVSRDFFYRNIAELHDIFKSTPSSFANILKLVAKRTYVEGEINTVSTH